MVEIARLAAKLHTLAQGKLALLEEYRLLSARLGELPAGEELAAWEGLLAQKEVLIRRMDEIDRQALLVEAEWRGVLGARALEKLSLKAEPRWQEVLNVRQALREALAEIRCLEETATAKALGWRAELIQKMRQLQLEKRGLQAYRQQISPTEGLLLDYRE